MRRVDPSFLCAIPQPEDVILAAKLAVEENPTNAPRMDFAGVFLAITVQPQFLAALTTRYWGKGGVDLGVSFLDTASAELRNKFLEYANRWSPHGNVRFRWSQSGGQIRITRSQAGYWSYLGTDCLAIKSGPTMCFQGFTVNTRDSEWERVVPHEFGHAAGFPHEHLRERIIARLDRAKTLAYFRRTQGWSDQTTASNVLTPIPESALLASAEADERSVMAYSLPASITKDGRPIQGGSTLSDLDKATVAKIYPKPSAPPPEEEEITITVPRAGRYVYRPQ